jgi:hypothetical protein
MFITERNLMKNRNYPNLVLAISFFSLATLNGCGGGDTPAANNITQPVTVQTKTGKFIDSAVSGLDYYIDGAKAGTTNAAGEFVYPEGKAVTFKVGSVTIGTASGDLTTVTPGSFGLDLAKVSNILVLLQSLDSDANPSNGIVIDPVLVSKLTTNIDLTSATNLTAIQAALTGKTLVTATAAINHFASASGAGSVATTLSIEDAVNKAVGFWYFACDGKGRSQVNQLTKTSASTLAFPKRLVRDYANANCTGAIVNSFTDTSSTDFAKFLAVSTLADNRVIATTASTFQTLQGTSVVELAQVTSAADGNSFVVVDFSGTQTNTRLQSFAFPN